MAPEHAAERDGGATITGEELAARIAAALATRADPSRAKDMARYMRDQFRFLGVPSPGQKKAWREATAGVPRLLSEAVVADAARALWRLPEREHQYLGCTLVNRHAGTPPRAPRATPEFVDTVEALLTTEPWWDTVDALAVHAVGDLVRHHPELRAHMDAWLAGDDMWLTRAALLHMNRWRAATDADWLFAACRARADHPDFFIRKAIGWALREYSKTDAAAVADFVAAHDHALSGLSRREALVWLDRRGRRASGGS